jgi:matrixin
VRLGAAVIVLVMLAAARPAYGYCRQTTCLDDCPRDARGCKSSGAPLDWPSSCVGFSLQRDGTAQLPLPAVEAAVRHAFAEWSHRDCAGDSADLVLLEDAMATCGEPEHNADGPNAHVIMFHDDGWDDGSPGHVIARTTVGFDSETGMILDADIELDSATNGFTIDPTATCDACVDLQAVLTHEVGHFIGLDHTSDRRATMSPGYEPGSTVTRSLDADDVAAVCNAYPPHRRAVCAPEPRNGFGAECHGAQSCALGTARAEPSALPWLWVLSAAAARRLRSPRARPRSARDRA